jgi:uncharacterized protein (TIGR03437 family)
LFIAVQAPQSSVSNSFLSGSYTVGTLDFLNAQSSLARQGYFTMTADGKGTIATFTVNGSAANLGTSSLTQSVAGATYAISGTAIGTLTIPIPSSSNAQSQIISGTKALYVSADGNYVVGGSTTGTDMIFGFRAPSGTSSNSLFNGTYFMAGLDADLSQNFLDAFYGSINTNGSGTALWHERFDDIVDALTFDNSFNSSVNIGAGGSYNDGTYTTLIGANGQAVMLIGSGQQFSLNVGVKAPSFTASSSVWINPIGITNAANYTPITNAYAPGELVNIYGAFGVTSQVDQVIPIPTTLGGVQVLVNGQPAPVYLVSANQISALIPYEVSGQFFATFQVVVNGTKSNPVTVYVDNSSPGIYTVNQNGVGSGAILHSNFTLVNDGSPATPGETVSLFMNGLGTVTPQVADGAAGPSNPLSNVNDNNVAVYLDDGVDTATQANITFAGLAPGFPGLYQVNFTVPRRGLGNGHVYIQFETTEGQNEMSTISLSGFNHAAAQIAPGNRARMRRSLSTPSSSPSSSLSSSRPASAAVSSAQSRRALPARKRENESSRWGHMR